MVIIRRHVYYVRQDDSQYGIPNYIHYAHCNTAAAGKMTNERQQPAQHRERERVQFEATVKVAKAPVGNFNNASTACVPSLLCMIKINNVEDVIARHTRSGARRRLA